MTDIEKIQIGLRDLITRVFIELTDSEIKEMVEKNYDLYKDWKLEDFQKLYKHIMGI